MIDWKAKLPVSLTNGTLVDVETTGLPSNSSAEMVTAGYITGNSVRILQRTLSDSSRQLLGRMPSFPKPIYAFNKGFEEHFLDTKIEQEIQAKQFERRRDAIQVAGMDDPFSGDGRRVVEAWKAYQSSKNVSHVQSIMKHNLSCLLTELCLLAVRKTAGPIP